VPAPETIHGTRVVAPPAALDATTWPAGATVLRFAPDDAFVIEAAHHAVSVAGEHAIVAAESGFAGCWLNAGELAHVAEHIEWPLPTANERPMLAQGLIAGVPAKLWLTGTPAGDRAALLLTNAPYTDELWKRLR
jgi:nitroreductase